MGRSLWVAELIISDETKRKLASKHGLSWHDVRDAIVCVSGLRYTWDDDPERGERALVELRELCVGNRWVLAILREVDDPRGDVYVLATAYLYDS